MARKIKKKMTAQAKNPEARPNPEKKECFLKKNKKLIIIAIVLASALILGIVFGIIALIHRDDTFDYFNADLSKYVYISSEDYKSFPVDSPLVSVDESDVTREINRLLVKNKDKTALFGGASVRPENYVIKLGDVVNVWYRGYITDENGVKTEVKGASNFKNSKPDAIEIGSGTLIKGFEEGLLGKPLHTKSMQSITAGKVEDGDIIYISYSAFLANGTPGDFSDVVIDTSDKEAVNKIYGEGFAEFFVGKNIGDVNTEAFRISGDDVDTVYYQMKVDRILRCDAEPYLINASFPADYDKDVSLRGVEVTFEIYASTAVIYNAVPEWNDAFIEEKLKETYESLSAYEGETLTQKYENKIRAELESAKESSNKTLLESEMWDHYLSKATIKSMPRAAINKAYAQQLGWYTSIYDVYGSGFASFGEFARSYFGLSEKDNWSDYIMAEAEIIVKEQLIFYYIIKNEGFVPNDAEFESLYNGFKNEKINEYKSEIEACETEEEKAAKLLEIEEKVLEQYGEEYFSELVYREYALEKLFAYAER